MAGGLFTKGPNNPRLRGMAQATDVGRLGVLIQQMDELLAEQRRTNELLQALIDMGGPPSRV